MAQRCQIKPSIHHQNSNVLNHTQIVCNGLGVMGLPGIQPREAVHKKILKKAGSGRQV